MLVQDVSIALLQNSTLFETASTEENWPVGNRVIFNSSKP